MNKYLLITAADNADSNIGVIQSSSKGIFQREKLVEALNSHYDNTIKILEVIPISMHPMFINVKCYNEGDDYPFTVELEETWLY